MNDMNAAVEKKEESTETCEFVELGEVTKDTRGAVIGHYYDGYGWWG